MLPWDLGIINAIKKNIEFDIFPSMPPEELRKTPYLIFELKNIVQGVNLISRADFVINIVDKNEITSAAFDILKSINKIINTELTLSQNDFEIGRAKIKINSVESKKNTLILNMTSILQLKAIYEDE